MKKKPLTPEQSKALLEILKNRFEKNMNRHKGLKWEKIQAKLESNPEKLWSLNEMEETEGEPDVVDYNQKNRRVPLLRLLPGKPKTQKPVLRLSSLGIKKGQQT